MKARCSFTQNFKIFLSTFKNIIPVKFHIIELEAYLNCLIIYYSRTFLPTEACCSCNTAMPFWLVL